MYSPYIQLIVNSQCVQTTPLLCSTLYPLAPCSIYAIFPILLIYSFAKVLILSTETVGTCNKYCLVYFSPYLPAINFLIFYLSCPPLMCVFLSFFPSLEKCPLNAYEQLVNNSLVALNNLLFYADVGSDLLQRQAEVAPCE